MVKSTAILKSTCITELRSGCIVYNLTVWFRLHAHSKYNY